MILGWLALLEPAPFRIWGWKVFAGVDRNWAALVRGIPEVRFLPGKGFG